jgi:hypothetical protein
MRSEWPALKGQESLAQGLPWVSRNKRFALKGLEERARSGSEFRSRFSPYLVAPSGQIRLGELTQGKPWAMFSWPLRARDWQRSKCRPYLNNSNNITLNHHPHENYSPGCRGKDGRSDHCQPSAPSTI